MNKHEKEINDLKLFINEVHKNAVNHGWYDADRSFGDIIALIHSELSEAFEFERNKRDKIYMDGRIDYRYHYSGNNYISTVKNENTNKPDGLIVELADVVIRVFDYIGSIKRVDDFIKALQEKHEYNKSRTYKHGGKVL